MLREGLFELRAVTRTLSATHVRSRRMRQCWLAIVIASPAMAYALELDADIGRRGPRLVLLT